LYFYRQNYYYLIDIKRFVKILFSLLIILLIISVLISILLTLPAVQTAIAKRLTDKINTETGVNLQIDKLQITLSGAIIIKDFIAFDEHHDTIFYGKRLRTYIRNPWKIEKDNQIKLGKTNIDELKGKIIYYKGSKKSNLDIFIDKVDGESTGKPNLNPFAITIQKLKITNSQFEYLDYNNDNPRILDFDKMQMDISDFVQKGDLVAFKANHIQMLDYRGLDIQELKTDFKYNNKEIRFDKLVLQTSESDINMNLVFISPNNGYSDFNNSVKIDAEISKGKLATDDLNKFSKVFAKAKNVELKSKISGTLNNLMFNNLDASTNNGIVIKGFVNLKNLLNTKKIKLTGDFRKLNFSFVKLNQLLPKTLKPATIEALKPLGEIQVTGKINYGTDNLITDIQTNTGLGDLIIKLKMTNLNDITNTDYHGHVKTENFKIKKLLKVDIDNLTSDFKVNGKGFTLNSLDAKFVGNIQRLLFNDYVYRNVLVNGDFKRKLFEGQFDISDENLEMDFSGLIDFSKPKRKIDFVAEICKANLYNLNFTKDEFSRVKGQIQAKAEGSSIDDIIGDLRVQNLMIVNQFDTYNFDDLLITSTFNNGERHINFTSTDIIDGYVKGKFKFADVPALIKNAAGSVFANYKIKPFENAQYINYQFNIHNKIISLINPKLKVSKNTSVKGNINAEENKLKLRVLSPKISYSNNEFKNVNLRIDNKNPLYNIFLKVDTIKTNHYKFKNLRLLNTTINDTLYLKTKFDGGDKFKDTYDIAFFYTMDELQNFIFGLQESILQFKSVPWKIDPEKNLNRIAYNADKDSLKVDDVGLFYKNEKINLSGIKYKDSLDFKINLDSIDLAHITPDLKDFNFKGKINGQIHIAKFKKEVLPSVNLTIKNFIFNNVLIGDLNLKVSALPGNNVFVDLTILKKNIQVLKLIGYIDFKKEKPKLNITLLLNEFPVKTLQNLFKDIFTNVRGKISGSVQIKGPVDNLKYDGKLYLNMFGLKILALNVDYQFKNRTEVYLHGQTFELKNAEFYDTKYNTKGSISGIIKHNNFKNWYLDLKINTDNLLVLDTPPDPLEMFYGTVFTAGKARIYGYVNHLKIDAKMVTKPKTNFVITLTDAETQGENDFVRIISKQDYKKEKQTKKKLHKIYEGLEMNFDLDITPDAQVEILLDQEFGSTLVARGTGLVLLEVNTNGQFNIFGDFAVEEGIYNFRYGGVIDKKFVVEPGSYISWEGDPYNATLDIKAVYETFADPTVILAEQGLTGKKMPVRAVIYLKDKLIKPTISFDLELPKANAILRSQVDYVLSDPDKKTLQVLSLLSFGNFINVNDYNLSRQAYQGAVKTVTETGLNILNSLMAQDDKFQVNLNYTSGDENIERNLITDPQVGLSLVTQINKKVYINGKVAIPVGRYTKSSIVGDVELEVYLDEKGNLVFRVFNKQTELEYIGQQEGYTQGIGISYQVDFDTFADILKKFGIIVKQEE